MRLEEGKSYVWMFGVYVLVMLASAPLAMLLRRNMAWVLLLLPACASFLLVVQWRSGLALSKSWRAIYPRGTTLYSLTLIANAVVVVLSLTLAVFAIVSMSHANHP